MNILFSIDRKKSDFWAELFVRFISNMTFFVGCGEAAADKLLRQTMLVEDLFKKVVLVDNIQISSTHNYMHILLEIVCLMETLSKLKNEWSIDRIIHIGMFDVIIRLV